ncbi:MAG TPA: M23 family metallopeptidase [Thermoanaerobaculia bacterium]|nr:M23 family metallopeptidase [Thermoanaerobaculia bacterium]
MVVFNLFFFTILLQLITMAVLARHPRKPFGAWFTTLIMTSGVTGFSVLAAPWGWFGVPLRFVIALLFVVALLVSLRRGAPEGAAAQSSPIRALVKVVVGVFFGGVAIGVLRAHSVPPGAIDLAFPLTRGAYLVGQGGSHSAANYHAQHPVQRYAVDVAKLNRAGMRARGLYPNDARAYAIFGDAVVSPCDGVVVAAADAFPDAARISLDEKNPAGNHVIVRCGDVNVTLAHLQRGSVAVRAGTTIARSTPIGRAGNSGNSTEPHLHVHGERNGAGVPLRFDGQWLVRNTIVRK